jgi:hypothetical protein
MEHGLTTESRWDKKLRFIIYFTDHYLLLQRSVQIWQSARMSSGFNSNFQRVSRHDFHKEKKKFLITIYLIDNIFNFTN